jgi:ABC-type dipeptide/oligopeptide/nickel transport system ATPase component
MRPQARPQDNPEAARHDRSPRLTKRYGDKLVADDLTFTVQPGIVTGLLGPNGTGKSTTMRMLLRLDAPTKGTATIGGRRYADQPAPLRKVGALLEAKAIHTGRSARNHLLAVAATTGIPPRRVEEVIDMVGLTDVAQTRRWVLVGDGPAPGHRLCVARGPRHLDPRRADQRSNHQINRINTEAGNRNLEDWFSYFASSNIATEPNTFGSPIIRYPISLQTARNICTS